MTAPFFQKKRKREVMKSFLKKMLALGLSAAIALPAVSGFAAGSVSYSGYLSTLEGLMNQCKAQGIATDYEMVNYKVIQRFEGYLNEDIQKGHTGVEFNKLKIDELYNEAKTNLEGYLNGTKTPFLVERSNMNNVGVSKDAMTDGTNPVYSIGYGHFSGAQNDVSNFQDFGTNNIQMEIGPSNAMTTGWIKESPMSPSYEEVRDGDGNYGVVYKSEKVSNKYFSVCQSVDVISGKTYVFSGYTKSKSAGRYFVSADEWNATKWITTAHEWESFEIEYTVPSGKSSINVRLLVDAPNDGVYFKDFALKEKGGDGENLLINLDFGLSIEAEDYKFDKNSSSVVNLLNVLDNAEENNVGVTLLLSTHYMVEDLKDEVYNKNLPYFLKYNIDHSETKKVTENFYNGLLPLVMDKKALLSICVSNEPAYYTNYFSDFYNPKFREYLQEVHGNINNLNKAYGTNYSDFSQISMPSEWSDSKTCTPIDYDWMQFNDKTFAAWHNWMVDIIKNIVTDVPVHSKIESYFGDGDSTVETNGWAINLKRGTDFELISSNMDIAGCDAWDTLYNGYKDEYEKTNAGYYESKQYYREMFYYDYMHSVLNKPVYNSEDHIFAAYNDNYEDNQRKHIANNLWQGAFHGRSLSTIWSWERSYDSTSDYYGSILFRPDCVAEVGKTNLNLQRLAGELDEFNQNKPKIALFYSKPTRLYQHSDAMKRIMDAYAAILNSGQKVGVVSEQCIDKLSNYDALVIPAAEYGSDAAYNAIKDFAANGGKVLYYGDIFSKNEYNKTRNNSALKSMAQKYSYTCHYTKYENETLNKIMNNFVEDLGISNIKITNSDGTDTKNLEWTYTESDEGLLINITNLEYDRTDYDSTKSLNIYYKGEKLDNMTDLISGTSNISTLSLEGHTPQLLSYEFDVAPNVEIKDVKVDKETKEITWSYSSDANIGANIYAANSDGSVSFIQKVSGGSYVCGQDGTYIIRAVRLGGESEGQIVSVFADDAAELAVTEISQGSGYVSLKISLKNTKSDYISPVVALKSEKGEEKSLLAYKKMTVAPGKTTEFNLYATLPAQASGFEVSVFDSILSQNLLCDGFSKSFSTSEANTLIKSENEVEKPETAKIETLAETENTENAEEAEETEISDTKAENAE